MAEQWCALISHLNCSTFPTSSLRVDQVFLKSLAARVDWEFLAVTMQETKGFFLMI